MSKKIVVSERDSWGAMQFTSTKNFNVTSVDLNKEALAKLDRQCLKTKVEQMSELDRIG